VVSHVLISTFEAWFSSKTQQQLTQCKPSRPWLYTMNDPEGTPRAPPIPDDGCRTGSTQTYCTKHRQANPRCRRRTPGPNRALLLGPLLSTTTPILTTSLETRSEHAMHRADGLHSPGHVTPTHVPSDGPDPTRNPLFVSSSIDGSSPVDMQCQVWCPNNISYYPGHQQP
jgi:hypothetical protein